MLDAKDFRLLAIGDNGLKVATDANGVEWLSVQPHTLSVLRGLDKLEAEGRAVKMYRESEYIGTFVEAGHMRKLVKEYMPDSLWVHDLAMLIIRSGLVPGLGEEE